MNTLLLLLDWEVFLSNFIAGFLIMMVIGSLTVMAIVILTFGKFIWADGYNSLNAVLVSSSFFTINDYHLHP